MILLQIYLLILLHLYVHELGHAAAARMIGVRIIRVKTGGGEPVLSFGKLEAALWITGGCTDVSGEDLAEKNFLQKLLFFEGGTIAGLLLALGASAVLNRFYNGFNAAVFFILAITNNCPFLPGSDIRGFLAAVQPDGKTAREQGDEEDEKAVSRKGCAAEAPEDSI